MTIPVTVWLASVMKPILKIHRLDNLAKSVRFVGLALLGLGALNQADAAKKPNILWIVGENFSLDLACYGQKNVSTPNLDRLAREGTRYTKVYSTSPVCAPSRSALMTGWYATTTDMHHMRSHRSDGFRVPAGVRPIRISAGRRLSTRT
ncbi:MAG: hypothetical protein Ct9H300mP32_6410 [Verrucomicrobiota bacterium]|nr:MAG: hypothetical protein Ct9H300mP32_6410 [Verrucomicrobiota bacterium]